MILSQPEGADWCGACGAPTRALTDDEMVDLLTEAVRSVVGGASPAAVFRELGIYTELQARSRWVCECPPPEPDPWWTEAPRSGFHLYRLWTADDRLLYVGVSTVLRSRLRTHHRRVGPLAARATWEEYPDAESMLLAETEAIRAEAPALNMAKVDSG